jgi:DNA/RNA-binding domain of Phe-tRNA-synthetase-like protein
MFQSDFPAPLGSAASPEWLARLLRLDADVPLGRSEETRAAVRDMLRFGGYKPTGRGKPSSEYLVRAATEGVLDRINPVVDACNAVSLHSGLPISVVDLDRTEPPLRVGIASEGSGYVFNASGQIIDVEGLLCLHDAAGPCANAVKDAQRTKTEVSTRRTLSLIWGVRSNTVRTRETVAWYRSIVERLGARTAAIYPIL